MCRTQKISRLGGKINNLLLTNDGKKMMEWLERYESSPTADYDQFMHGTSNSYIQSSDVV